MGYIIHEIKTVDTVNDGNVLVVKVYPIRSNYGDNSGTIIAFAFPYSEQLFTQLSQISNNHKIWEPNEEDFVEDVIEVSIQAEKFCKSHGCADKKAKNIIKEVFTHFTA